jgi:ABC-type hemin transport system substrate-binding protein
MIRLARISRRRLLALLLPLGVLVFAGSAEPVHEERILALAPHIVEILFAIGAGDRVVGVGSFADHPEEARRLPRVATHERVSLEPALRLRPTLAIALDRGLARLDELERLGVRVEVSHPHTVVGVLDEIVHMGRIAGREDRARALERALRERLEEMHARRPPVPPRVFYEVWHSPLIAAGGRSFVSDALRELGFVNVFGDVPLEAPRVSVESVVRAAPDVVVVTGEGGDAQARVSFWREWLGEEARVVVAAYDRIHRPGPRLFDGMEELQADVIAALEAPPRREPDPVDVHRPRRAPAARTKAAP